MLGLSNLFSDFSKNKLIRDAIKYGIPDSVNMPAGFETRQDVLVGGYIAAIQFNDFMPEMVNIGACFYHWWGAVNRIIWQVREDSSAYIRKTGLSFIPETPPKTWQNDAIVIEGINNSPIVHDFFSIAAYKATGKDGKEKYFFIGLRAPDGIMVSSINADQQEINERLAKEEALLSTGYIKEGGIFENANFSAAEQLKALDLIRFVFALSIYALNPHNSDYIRSVKTPGPPARNEKGKPEKKGGKIVSLWSYADLSIERQEVKESDQYELDKNKLSLEPVIVSPHIRRQGDKIIIVDSYSSHRWKQPGKIGKITKL